MVEFVEYRYDGFTDKGFTKWFYTVIVKVDGVRQEVEVSDLRPLRIDQLWKRAKSILGVNKV